MSQYSSLLSTLRFRPSSKARRHPIDEFFSDRSRILYCSSFRRLQQKAQVFSLEPNSNVRSRLTHSLEVSDLGRLIANDIAFGLYQRGHIDQEQISEIVAVVENVCLMHDIGNPPFGHFGEAAIRAWAKTGLRNVCPFGSLDIQQLSFPLFSDFDEFDGNPQGFRILTRLHTDVDESSLNMTFATLLCALKYTRAPGEQIKAQGVTKKPGFFHTESDLVSTLRSSCGVLPYARDPFTYIMEAADDIAYCMSDMIDGMEKRILTEDEFIAHFKEAWDEKSYGEYPPALLGNHPHGFSRDFSVPWSNLGRQSAVNAYLDHEDIYKEGSAPSLIAEDSEIGRILDTCRAVARKTLYASPAAENVEITGFATITGILHAYEPLLALSLDDFDALVHGRTGLAYELRLFHRLGKRFVKAYMYALSHIRDSDLFPILEWYLRVHLLIDHVSAMTDDYALATYQMFLGLKPIIA